MYIGIDPGITGAIAILDANGNYQTVIDMPTMAKGKGSSKVKNQINPAALYDVLHVYSGASAVLELVNAMPGQGVSSMFSLGDSFGATRAILAALNISTHLVSPQIWKKYYKIKSDKEIARAKAIQLFPSAPLARKKDIGRAEALLMAKYAAEKLKGSK